MKFRSGFVSNSSSSSYICEVCGDTFETWDEGISHFNLVMCRDYEHLFCEDHRINSNDDGNYTMYEIENEENRIDSKHCPICQLEHVTDFMALMYAAKRLNVTVESLKRDISEDFENYEQLDDYLFGEESSFDVELTAHVHGIKAGNKELAHKAARELVVKNPMMLDVTYCE